MDLRTKIILGIASIPIIIYLIQGVIDFFKIKNIDDYFLAGRKISTLSCALNSVTANFSFVTAVFVTLTWSYQYGVAVWWTIITALLGFIAYAIPKISPIKDTEFFSTGNTLHEYLGIRYRSSFVRFVASLATITAFLGFFVAELYIFAAFLTQYIKVDIWTLIFALAAINAIYTILGGFESVLSTDKYQLLFTILGLGCIFFILTSGFPNLSNTIKIGFEPAGLIKPIPPFDPTPALFLLMLIIINGLWQFSAMDMWQRSLAAQKQNRISKASILGGIIFALIAIPIILAGMGIKLKFPSTQFTPFEIIEKLLQKQPAIVVGGLISLFASASLASVETTLIALSQSVLYDVLGTIRKRTEKPSIKESRIAILIIIISGLLFLYVYMKYFKFDLVSFLLTFFSCQIVLLPSILYQLLRRPPLLSHWPATASIITGYAISLLFGLITMEKQELQAITPVLGLGSAIIVFSVMLPFYTETGSESSDK